MTANRPIFQGHFIFLFPGVTQFRHSSQTPPGFRQGPAVVQSVTSEATISSFFTMNTPGTEFAWE